MSKSPPRVSTPDLEVAVRERYTGAARAREIFARAPDRAHVYRATVYKSGGCC